MNCRRCGHKTRVVTTLAKADCILRRRECRKCKRRMQTVESSAIPANLLHLLAKSD